MSDRPVLLVKLGGSILTDKRRPGTVREDVLRRLAGEIAEFCEGGGARVVLGHGSGSFGHVAASQYDLATGVHSPRQLRGVAVTQRQAHRLHQRVSEALLDAGARPYSLAPSSFLVASLARPASFSLEPLLAALELGLLPVVFGDVVMDREMGASICSTETLLRLLARQLPRQGHRVDRAIWVGETDGIYDAEGKTIAEIRRDNLERAVRATGGSSGIDVTGGMRHRLEIAWALAADGLESRILDGLEPGRLLAALRGEACGGTRVVAG